MRNMKSAGILVLSMTVVILAVPRPAAAWNATGHRLVALVAWELLDADAKTAVIAILREHPRFEPDFELRMPSSIVDSDDDTKVNQWIFAQAAVWPDIARRQRAHHRPTWHYINDPLFVDEIDREFFGDDVPVNLERAWVPGMRSRKMNIAQALMKTDARLGSDSTDRSERAIYMCWLLHLVGDVHQPLHTSALFTPAVFPEGDEGGNKIPIRGKGNLHSAWDKSVGSASAPSALVRRARSLLQVAKLRTAGEVAADDLSVETWIEESYDLAIEHVYAAKILDAVREAESEVAESDEELELIPIRLPSEYFDNATSVSEQRIVEAGFRVAEKLKALTR